MPYPLGASTGTPMTSWETKKEHRDVIEDLTANYYLLAHPDTPGQKTFIRADPHTTRRNEISIGVTVSYPDSPQKSVGDPLQLGLIEHENAKRIDDVDEFRTFMEILLDLREPSECDRLDEILSKMGQDNSKSKAGLFLETARNISSSKTGVCVPADSQDNSKSKAELFLKSLRHVESSKKGVCVPVDSVTNFPKKRWSRSTCPQFYLFRTAYLGRH